MNINRVISHNLDHDMLLNICAEETVPLIEVTFSIITFKYIDIDFTKKILLNDILKQFPIYIRKALLACPDILIECFTCGDFDVIFNDTYIVTFHINLGTNVYKLVIRLDKSKSYIENQIDKLNKKLDYVIESL